MPPNMPASWPDPDAYWLWDRNVTTMGVPPGTCYFRSEDFTIPTARPAEVWAAGDDTYELWLDGVKLMEDDAFTGQAKKARVALDAGDHYLAARVTNLNNLRAGLIVTVMALDPQGTTTGALFHTDSNWVILPYPTEPPGFTPGRVMEILLEEAQARGALADVVLGFSAGKDSAGEPWPVGGEIAFPIGSDLLSALKQLAETYGDLRMFPGPGLALGFWGGGVGEITSVDLDSGVNLTGLHHDGAV